MNMYEKGPTAFVDGKISPEDIANLDLDVEGTEEIANERVNEAQNHLSELGRERGVQDEIDSFSEKLTREEDEEKRRGEEERMRLELMKTREEMRVQREIADLNSAIKKDVAPDLSSRPVYEASLPPIAGLENVDARTLTIEEGVPELDSFGRPIPKPPKVEDPWGFAK